MALEERLQADGWDPNVDMLACLYFSRAWREDVHSDGTILLRYQGSRAATAKVGIPVKSKDALYHGRANNDASCRKQICSGYSR